MKKNILVGLVFLLFVSIFIVSSFAQTTQTQVSCRTNWDCRNLNRTVKLDHNICVGQEHLYDGRSDPLIPIRPYILLELVGKTYTDFLQTSYTTVYKCGSDGFCEVDKAEVQRNRDYVKCKYGCLVTPVEKNGKVYSNFCVCLPGQEGSVYCDSSKGRHIYYKYKHWTCEYSERVAMYCPVSTQCAKVPGKPNERQCKPVEGIDVLKIGNANANNVQYTLLIPGNLASAPIKVALIKNGRIIAEKPISSMSALEYINKYGPVNASNAYAFAQKLGLTAYASNASRSTSVSSTRNNTSARTLTGTLSIASAGINSYKTAYSYRNSYSNYYYKPTTTYRTSSSSSYSTTYYRPTTSYTTYYTSYTPSSTYSSYRSTYYRPTTYSNYSSSSSTASRNSYPTYSSYSYYRRYRYYTPSSTRRYSYPTSNSTVSRSTGNIAVSSTASTYSSSRYYYARRFS